MATDFHRRAKVFYLNFFIRNTRKAKVVLAAGQFARFPSLIKTLPVYFGGR